MKLEDRVEVTYANGSKFAGQINGETEKSWKIKFDNGDQKTVRKTTEMKVLEVVETPVEEVVETPVEEVVETPVEEVVETPVEEKISVTADEFLEAAGDIVGPEPTKYTPSKGLKKRNLIILGVIIVVMVAIGIIVTTAIF